jgi:hypothetical protein
LLEDAATEATPWLDPPGRARLVAAGKQVLERMGSTAGDQKEYAARFDTMPYAARLTISGLDAPAQPESCL